MMIFKRQNQKRRLNDEDVLGFFTAADSRSGAMTRDEVIAAIEKRNAYRLWRIRHDFKWLQKQMKKLGQNPDDARELL